LSYLENRITFHREQLQWFESQKPKAAQKAEEWGREFRELQKRKLAADAADSKEEAGFLFSVGTLQGRASSAKGPLDSVPEMLTRILSMVDPSSGASSGEFPAVAK
jgi:hypothetical protein